MFDESSPVRASPLGLQRFVCRSWVAIVFIMSRLVPDYVILNFRAGRRRERHNVITKSKYFTRVVTVCMCVSARACMFAHVCRKLSHYNSNANTKDSVVRRRFLCSANLAFRVSKLASSYVPVVFNVLRITVHSEWIHIAVHTAYNPYFRVLRGGKYINFSMFLYIYLHSRIFGRI